MSDKKSCRNCSNATGWNCSCGLKEKCENFNLWQRDPDLWLDILPTEEGWYWYKKAEEKPDIIYVNMAMINDNNNIYAKTFQWQGPIRPNNKGEK